MLDETFMIYRFPVINSKVKKKKIRKSVKINNNAANLPTNVYLRNILNGTPEALKYYGTLVYIQQQMPYSQLMKRKY